ncbi:MAG: hypothetical protein EBR26_05850, partial [Microbacteriaceae bacterium]|nr:hypothetical protein [Microbacteriaceae bacterium]
MHVEDSTDNPEVLIEEVVVEELAPVGEESVAEFEKLLSSAAPEETATALEESSGTAPSNIVVPGDEYRDRKPISQFFGWLGVSSVLTPLLLTYVLVESGLTAQAIAFDLVIGYLAAGLFIATAGLAGKRSGLSTAVISRAVFGVWGNSIPLSLLVISRLLIAAIVISLVVVLGDGVSPMLQPFDTVLLNVAGLNMTAGFAVGLVFLTIVLGFTLLRGKVSRISLLVLSSGAALIMAAFLVGVSQENLVMLAPGTQGPTSFESLAATALIFVVVVVTWVGVAPNLSKAVPMKPRGWKVFVSILGAQFVLPVVISLLLLSWIGPAVLVTPAVGELRSIPGLVTSLPNWTQLVIIVGIALSLLYMASLNLKTTSLDLIALFRIRSRILSSVLSWFLVALVLFWFVQQPAGRTVEYLVNVFVLVAMLSAGWVGMFVADVGVRKIAYHELSLNRAYGFYGKFNWLSIAIWLVTVGVSVAVIPVNLMGFGFTGALAPSLGLDDSLASQSVAITA